MNTEIMMRLLLVGCACGFLSCAHQEDRDERRPGPIDIYTPDDRLVSHLKLIPLANFQMRDVSLKVVLESFEKMFEDYRRHTHWSKEGLVMTMFKIQASENILEQKVSFQTTEEGSLWDGVVLLSEAADGLVVTHKGIGFPLEEGQVVIRNKGK